MLSCVDWCNEVASVDTEILKVAASVRTKGAIEGAEGRVGGFNS